MPSFVTSPIATLSEFVKKSSLLVAMNELRSSVSPPAASPTNSWFTSPFLFATITSAMPSFVTSPITTLLDSSMLVIIGAEESSQVEVELSVSKSDPTSVHDDAFVDEKYPLGQR
jgi:hypothetical protein